MIENIIKIINIKFNLNKKQVWQYITLTKRIYLIDCPGHVYVHDGKDTVEVVLRGCGKHRI